MGPTEGPAGVGYRGSKARWPFLRRVRNGPVLRKLSTPEPAGRPGPIPRPWAAVGGRTRPRHARPPDVPGRRPRSPRRPGRPGNTPRHPPACGAHGPRGPRTSTGPTSGTAGVPRPDTGRGRAARPGPPARGRHRVGRCRGRGRLRIERRSLVRSRRGRWCTHYGVRGGVYGLDDAGVLIVLGTPE